METTIKGMEVIAYKGMNSDMTCKGFQYEIRKTYKTDKAELCECGFHSCLNPRDVLMYYSQKESSRYFKVKLSGEIAKCDFYNTKVAATEITILEEINIDEIIETTKWWKNDNVLDLLYFSDGLAKVQRKDRLYNFIDTKGKILSNEWFIDAYSFHDGLAKVQRKDNKWNFIDKDGNYLYNEWFNYLGDFHDGFTKVQREDRLYNFINKDGNFLSKEWFDWVDYFQDGFALVERENHEYNYIDKQGKLISNEWFKFVRNFKDGLARVQKKVNGMPRYKYVLKTKQQ